MLRIGVCDDDKEFRQRLMQMIRIWSDHSGIPTELYPFDNGDELISKNAAFRMDIILLDIVMPLLNGMDTARELRAQDTAVKIIFLTSSPEFALESYEVRAQDYLLKPITYERLRRALEDCSHLFEAEPKNMVLKTSFGFQKSSISTTSNTLKPRINGWYSICAEIRWWKPPNRCVLLRSA